MSKNSTPHDKLFRETMSEQAVAADFLRNYLPAEVCRHLRLETLGIMKDSFVDAENRGRFSDLLYQVTLTDDEQGFVYFLFEHKSRPDRFVALQLLGYMLEIWELYRKQHKGRRVRSLPLIIPVVVYHGKTRQRAWRLRDLVTAPHAELAGYVPDFDLAFHDFSPHSREEIRGLTALRLLLTCLRARNEPESLEHVKDILRLLNELDENEPSRRRIVFIFEYVSQVMDIDAEAMQNITDEVLSETKEESFMTLVEQWRQQGMQIGLEKGIEQGIEKGLEQGIEQGRRAQLERLLRKRFGDVADAPRYQQMLHQAGVEDLDIWAERLLDAETIDEVFVA